MRQEAVKLVFCRQIEVWNRLLGFGEATRNGFAGGAERNHFDALGSAAAAACRCFDVFIGDTAASTSACDGAQVHTQLIG